MILERTLTHSLYIPYSIYFGMVLCFFKFLRHSSDFSAKVGLANNLKR